MEQKQNTLPSDIDSQILQLIRTITDSLNQLADGWKLLTATIVEKDKKIAELEAPQTEEGENA